MSPLRAVQIIVVVLVAAYAGLFLSWNNDAGPIVTWNLGATLYQEGLPVGALPLAGVILGVVITTLLALGSYRASQAQLRTAQADRTSAQDLLEKAKARVRTQKEAITKLEQQKAELQKELADLRGEAPAAAAPSGPAAEPEAPAEEA